MTDYTDLKRRLLMPWAIADNMKPLLPEAAAAIAALEAEVARLKATSPQPAPPADKT